MNPTGRSPEPANVSCSSGMTDEAYERYAHEANPAGATSPPSVPSARNIRDGHRHPHPYRSRGTHARLRKANGSPPRKDAKLYDLALDLARQSPVDHLTLMRAVENYAESQAEFAVKLRGCIALHWICAGQAYEANSSEVRTNFDGIMKASEFAHCQDSAREAVRKTLSVFPNEKLVRDAWQAAAGESENSIDQASLSSTLIFALISAISAGVACPLRSACRDFQSRFLS